MGGRRSEGSPFTERGEKERLYLRSAERHGRESKMGMVGERRREREKEREMRAVKEEMQNGEKEKGRRGIEWKEEEEE